MHISAFGAALRTPDLRKKILFTLGLLALFRLGSVVPTPGIDYTAIQTCITQVQDNSVYALVNLFSGGALLRLSVFALGIMPYITASIILQLLTVVIPRLETLKADGTAGQAKITQYTRYLTIGLAILQSTAILSLARSPGALFQGCQEEILPNQGLWVMLVMVTVMTAGTAIVMWFGELITERGIGNGMSLLIFTSIIATIPSQFLSILVSKGAFAFVLTLAVGLVVVALVVFVEQAQRRIPVQYAKRMVGRRMYGGTSTLLVQLSGADGSFAQWIQQNFGSGTGTWYLLFYFLLIVFFCYFYVSITFNPVEVADNMKKYGGFIPGIRAGKPTAQYLDYVLTRLTAPGSLYLGLIAIVPVFAFGYLGVANDFIFGGTSLLIMVGVGLDTVKQIQSQLQQRNYEGFLG
jgi:preprotein translocase subunit SecY